MEPINRRFLKLKGLSAITPESIFYIFSGNDPIRIKVEITKAPIANGLTLNTMLKSFGKVRPANSSNRIHLNSF